MEFVRCNGEEIRTFDMFTIINLLKEMRFFKYTKKDYVVHIYIDDIYKHKNNFTILKYSLYQIDTGEIRSGYMYDIVKFANDFENQTFHEMAPDMVAKVLLLR